MKRKKNTPPNPPPLASHECIHVHKYIHVSHSFIHSFVQYIDLSTDMNISPLCKSLSSESLPLSPFTLSARLCMVIQSADSLFSYSIGGS